jgi:hypothetical protein
MSPLRQQMIDAMVLRGLATRTQRAYLSVLVQLSRHYGCSPDRLDSAQVQAWLVFRIRQQHLAYATVNQAVCALKFFFGTVLGREADALTIPYARTPSLRRRSCRARNWPACSRRPTGCGPVRC